MREGCPDVLDAEAPDEKLAQLDDPRDERCDLPLPLRLALDERRIEIADGADARGRGCDDQLGIAENPDEPLGEGGRLGAVAGVQVHLPAAGLLAPELDLVTQPLEHLDDGLAGLRRERVGQTGDEERDPQRRPIIASTAVQDLRQTREP